jgi:hypothetical protein
MRFPLFFCFLALSVPGFSQQPGQIAPGVQHTGAEYGAYDVKIEIPAHARDILQAGQKGETVSIAGAWKCRLDPNRSGLVEGWQNQDLELPIKLPGSLDTGGYGGETDKATLANLHKKRTFVGPAWYQRDIEIPAIWQGKRISLLLERVMWESRVWVDGHSAGLQDSLSTPQHYDLSRWLTPGRHRLTIRVDNSWRPGPNAHGYSDDIQPKWNGIIGRMELSARAPVFIDDLTLEPDLNNKQVRVRAVVVNTTGAAYDGVVRLRAKVRGGAESPFVAKEIYVRVNSPATQLMADYPMTEAASWDEFSPALYEMEATLGAQLAEKDAKDRPATVNDVTTEIFGMRSFKGSGNQFSWNGRTAFLRGTHDGMGFPLTGYPAMDVESWIRIYQTLKAYGLNHVRFHSVCPPEAAFTAADLEGIIVQAELPAWGDIKESAPGTAFLRAELIRIIKAYGNHPSFALMSMGNEHSGDWTVLGDFVDMAKRLDARRLYAASSNEYIRKGPGLVNPGDDFAAAMWGNGKGEERLRYFDDWVRGASPQPASDFKSIISQFPVPVMSHELGQYWIFPSLTEIDSYKGVMQPGALKMFRERLTAAGLIKDVQAFSAASGALSIAIYKEEIEKIFRTGSIGGFQLLDLHDYSGQNTSLVGILDALWNTKGLIAPAQWRRFCSSSVVVARLPKFVFAPSDSFDVPVEIAHYGKSNVVAAHTRWNLFDSASKVIAFGEVGVARDVATGASTSLGNIKLDLKSLPAPGQYRLEVEVAGVATNDWNIWLLPEAAAPQPTETVPVMVTEKMDPAAWAKLKAGGTVVWLGSGSPSTVPINFVNALWNPWCEGSVKTCGLLVDPAHPAMAGFPTASHGDWQWFDLLPLTARGFVMNEVPAGLSIPVQGIDNPMRAFRIGLLWEAMVGKGTLIATSLDLTANLEQRPAAAQFRRCLMTYASSGKAHPVAQLTEDQACRLVEDDRFQILPAEPPLAGAVLDVLASANLTEPIKWSQKLDEIKVRETGFDYALEQNENARWKSAPDVSRRNDTGGSWTARDFQIRIKAPETFAGDVFLLLKTGSTKAAAVMETDRSACYVGAHAGDGKWVRIHMLPANQGTLVVKIYPPAGAEPPQVARLVVAPHK